MDAKCIECGYKLPVDSNLIKTIIGGGLMASGAIGWATYAFAGLLGFYGGAALIAIALLAGGGTILSGKDMGLVIKVGTKITEILNDNNYECSKCGCSEWVFSGFKDTDIVNGTEHIEELSVALRDSRRHLLIASGFLSSNVINELFITNLKSTLIRGVSVTLIFSSERSHSDFMLSGYKIAYGTLSRLADEFSNLELIKKHTHQKGIIVDDRYAIVGSFNFLSNKKIARDETSVKIFASAEIKKVKRSLLAQ